MRIQGRYADFEPLNKRVLAIREKGIEPGASARDAVDDSRHRHRNVQNCGVTSSA